LGPPVRLGDDQHPVGGRVTTCQEPFAGGGVVLSEYPFSAGVGLMDEAADPNLII
jgi:hypothetical protein